MNSNVILTIVIKSQEKRAGEKGKKELFKKKKKTWKIIHNGNKYIPINDYFKCKQINVPIERHRVEWIKTQIFIAYKRFIADL